MGLAEHRRSFNFDLALNRSNAYLNLELPDKLSWVLSHYHIQPRKVDKIPSLSSNHYERVSNKSRTPGKSLLCRF